MIDTSISLPNCPKNHDHTEVCTVSLDEVRERVMDAVPEKFWETNFSGDDHKADSEMSVVTVSNLSNSIPARVCCG